MTWPFGRCGCVGYLYNVVVVFVAATALLLVVVGTITPSGVCTTMTRRWCLRHLWRNEIHNLSSKRFPLTNVVSVFFQHGHRVWLNLYVEDCWNECWWWLVWGGGGDTKGVKGQAESVVCGFPRLEKTFPPVNRQIMNVEQHYSRVNPNGSPELRQCALRMVDILQWCHNSSAC